MQEKRRFGPGRKANPETDWESLLSEEGMPAELPEDDGMGRRVRLGDGLGIKGEEEERAEDEGGHSSICPLNLGKGVDFQVDQPEDRPVEDSALRSARRGLGGRTGGRRR